ncbi:MAG: hypothetical protein J7J98_09640 [candidate division Zixibacteria bacterium]|nr:hypothetical protein [candidate division Zixibacteria bacterium]
MGSIQHHTRSHSLGQQVGVKFAEAFTIKENLLIDTPPNAGAVDMMVKLAQ